ncbi:MAG: GatB/YqeY domain-containing protein [Candidatus Berkelbacteria bacterium]|nr:GatB/YqeY domain-containing protein [Candidatus Berkelbacteria bacterium]MCR4307567.1 GatB/YqeY domain-containing protein [Candidatus Berkelbacteria bacterium]
MALIEQIETELTTALKSGNNFSRDTLRLLKSSIKNAEIEAGQALSDEQVVSLIQKEVKKRIEAETLFKQANKPDLAANEASEAELLKKYLPEQMSEEGIKAVIAEYLSSNPTDISQMGTAMGALSSKLKGQADMGLVSKILRDQIQNG